MKEFIETYRQHRDEIEFILRESIRNIGELSAFEQSHYAKLFDIFSSLELVYVVNEQTRIQVSSNYHRHRVDDSAKGANRSHLISRLAFEGEDLAFSTPYISSTTRSNCITATLRDGENIYFLDFEVEILLEKLHLVELHKPFHSVTKGFYIFAGGAMMILSFITVAYSAVDFVSSIVLTHMSLELIFKPIIALTLGVAIFDLAKTILEREVFFKSYSKNSEVEGKMLSKFLSTIIIALSIEALVVVFKIALNDYEKMINAFYLISGISLILVSLTIFVRSSPSSASRPQGKPRARWPTTKGLKSV